MTFKQLRKPEAILAISCQLIAPEQGFSAGALSPHWGHRTILCGPRAEAFLNSSAVILQNPIDLMSRGNKCWESEKGLQIMKGWEPLHQSVNEDTIRCRIWCTFW